MNDMYEKGYQDGKEMGYRDGLAKGWHDAMKYMAEKNASTIGANMCPKCQRTNTGKANFCSSWGCPNGLETNKTIHSET